MDTPPGDDHSSGPGALADRRWLIGIAISLVFGIFGAVMAVLSYTERNDAPAPRPGPAAPAATAVTSSPTPPPAPHGRDKKAHGRE